MHAIFERKTRIFCTGTEYVKHRRCSPQTKRTRILEDPTQVLWHHKPAHHHAALGEAVRHGAVAPPVALLGVAFLLVVAIDGLLLDELP